MRRRAPSAPVRVRLARIACARGGGEYHVCDGRSTLCRLDLPLHSDEGGLVLGGLHRHQVVEALGRLGTWHPIVGRGARLCAEAERKRGNDLRRPQPVRLES